MWLFLDHMFTYDKAYTLRDFDFHFLSEININMIVLAVYIFIMYTYECSCCMYIIFNGYMMYVCMNFVILLRRSITRIINETQFYAVPNFR